MLRIWLNPLAAVILIISLLAIPLTESEPTRAFDPGENTSTTSQSVFQGDDVGPQQRATRASRRLIVELASPPLSVAPPANNNFSSASGRLDVSGPGAQSYIHQLRAEQATAISAMQGVLPNASVGTYVNETGGDVQETYQVVFNGFVVDPGSHDTEEARRALAQLPGVKGVYPDYAREPDLYNSLPSINASAVWTDPAVEGRSNAGRGIKVASMDGGIHHSAPMFDGTGYSYPPGFPKGDTANTNGKIIVSRAYFRSWDPPAEGDENTWPGTRGTSHGVHTASTAAGNTVTANYQGTPLILSGVAPAAWVMSYRVFYYSVTGNGSFYDAEGIAALEDIVRDGADVLNNSWGAGPYARGGDEPLDRALINAASAGIFVSMSAGNSGPSKATTDHPSNDYINVAASSTDGTLISGRMSASAPQPISATLQSMPYVQGDFGGSLTAGAVYTDTYVTARSTNPANEEGCSAWPAGAFTGKAVVISRGTCEFGLKALNAQDAGAAFVVVHNSSTGGDALLTMGPGAVGISVTIPAVFVGYSKGIGLANWYDSKGSASQITIDTTAFNAAPAQEIIASFSSRGPGVGNVLKPDIAAPGINILAQGYTPDATGEARHLGYGRASGTSMAAPHVTGAAAVLRQIHPTWSNAYIKSALMSTAKYLDVYNSNGTPAQPLDMGAGRMDLTRAANPGVILNPPSLSFGLVPTGTQQAITVSVTSVATATETYNLSTVFTGNGFTATTTLPGITVSPSSLTLAPGASGTFVVTFNSANGSGLGDNQGYIVLDGATYDAHLPAWARVTYANPLADILIIDNDASSNPSIMADSHLGYYTRTLESLGYTYNVLDIDSAPPPANGYLDTVNLLAYRAIIYFTGDNYAYSRAPTLADNYRLNEYAQNGGTVIAMGQDASSVVQTFRPFYWFTLGGWRLRDSVTNNIISPTFEISPTSALPLAGLKFDLGTGGDGADNQRYVDEIRSTLTVTDSNSVDPKYTAVLSYNDPNGSSTVGMAHRQQPTLEAPDIYYRGRSIYATFGLEGVNNDKVGYSTREQLIQRALNWGWDEPGASISTTGTGRTRTFTANFTSNISGVGAVSYRWDFGDGTPYEGPSASPMTSHSYTSGGTRTVRVEVTDSLGNKAISSTLLVVPDINYYYLYLPIIE
ncbi:MAG: S8 family serine peptidase, partial [Chloroflexi bacterium]|nr:S8 family serine peptidase [Chloroflexota bacterium]